MPYYLGVPFAFSVRVHSLRSFVTPFTICGRCLAPSPSLPLSFFGDQVSAMRNCFRPTLFVWCGFIAGCSCCSLPTSPLILALMIESKDVWKMSTSEKIMMQICGCRTVLIQNVAPFSHGINCRHQLLRLRNYLCLASVARDTGICCRRLGSRHMVFRQYCEILVVRKRDPPNTKSPSVQGSLSRCPSSVGPNPISPWPLCKSSAVVARFCAHHSAPLGL